MFIRKPFNLKKDSDIQLLARYLIEDNNVDQIKFITSREADLYMIKSILKTSLKQYKLYTMEEEEHFHNSIQSVFIKLFLIISWSSLRNTNQV